MTVGDRVIVTRSQPGADRTANALSAMGVKAVLAPVLTLEATGENPNGPPFRALVFTSVNGVAFSPPDWTQNTVTCFCVGERTARAARNAGYRRVISADGDSQKLVDCIRKAWAPEDGPLVHAGHARPRGDIVKHLVNAGYDARHAALYDARPSDEGVLKIKRAIKTGSPAIILVYSPEAGAIVANALDDAQEHAHIRIIAISDATANPVRSLAGVQVDVADNPNEDAMLRLLNAP